MSLLPSATFAGPSQAEALWAVAGSTGPGGGVTQLVAGANITLDPPTGEGVVTINATGGGGGGGVTSIVAGAGIGVSSPAGDVTVSNTGVTSIIAGSGILASSGTGAVTLQATFPQLLAANYILLSTNVNAPTSATSDICNVGLQAVNANQAIGYIYNPAWSLTNDAFLFDLSNFAAGSLSGAGLPTTFSVSLLKLNSSPPSIQVTLYSTVAFSGTTPSTIYAQGQLVRFAGRGL